MDKPIRVIQIFGSLNMGGAESRMVDVFEKIDKDRYQFTFLAMDEAPQYYEEKIKKLGGEILKIPAPRKDGFAKNFFKICKILKNGKYDVIHAHTSFHCGVVMLAGWLSGIPVRIAHSRTTGSQNTSFKNKVALAIGRTLIKIFSTKCIAISKDAGKFLFKKSKFEVIPNAIDYEKYFNVPDESVNELKKFYNVKDDCVCLGLVGRFDVMKNHEFAIKVFDAYHKKNQNSVMFFIGDGICRSTIENQIKELHLEDSVILTGFQSNVNEWMTLFDVILVPSFFEGLGGVILEAQAAGTPVIKSSSFSSEADLNIGLVKELSIYNGTEEWVSCIDEIRDFSVPNQEARKNAFEARGYSLNYEINMLENLYQGLTK